jgi:hypothetical protein
MKIQQYIKVIESDYPGALWEYNEILDLIESDHFYFMRQLSRISGWLLEVNPEWKNNPDEVYNYFLTPSNYM